MDKETQKLLREAELARSALYGQQMDYDRALEIVKKYTDHANKKAEVIAKRFGIKTVKKIDPRGFLR